MKSQVEIKKNEEKKQRKRNIWLGIVLTIIMFGSIFGLIVNSFGQDSESKDNNVDFNGYKFIHQNGFYILIMGKSQFVFQSYPTQDFQNVNLTKVLPHYQGQVLYVDSQDSEAVREIYQNMNSVAQRIQMACLEEKDCPEDLPIKTCEDNIIVIKESQEEQIYEEGNCVHIRGAKENLLKLTDEYLFRIMGIK